MKWWDIKEKSDRTTEQESGGSTTDNINPIIFRDPYD